MQLCIVRGAIEIAAVRFRVYGFMDYPRAFQFNSTEP